MPVWGCWTLIVTGPVFGEQVTLVLLAHYRGRYWIDLRGIRCLHRPRTPLGRSRSLAFQYDTQGHVEQRFLEYGARQHILLVSLIVHLVVSVGAPQCAAAPQSCRQPGACRFR